MAQYRKQVLTPLLVRNLGPGRHLDGDGLYLLVEPSGAKRWMLRVVIDGRRRDIGLGGYRAGWEPKASVDLMSAQLFPGSIAAARREAARLRATVKGGADPLAERRALRAVDRAKRKTFEDYATDYIKAHRPRWANAKHAAQWTSTLTTYAYPFFGEIVIGQVDRTMVLEALRPIWIEKPETATRVRGRIEAILDAAKADGYRTGDNPAAWAGNLETSLPQGIKKARVVHHAALPYREVAAFVKAVRAQPGTAARALEFTILTAARTGEVIGARWNEIDDDDATWTIPKERMKAKKSQRVPLSRPAVALLDIVRGGHDDFLFPSGEKSLSNMAMLELLKRMKRTDITVHGFRSTFRDWAAEQTPFPREVIEHALAHQLADAAEAAYQRGDLLRKRRALMDAWGRHCTSPTPAPASVASVRRTASRAA